MLCIACKEEQKCKNRCPSKKFTSKTFKVSSVQHYHYHKPWLHATAVRCLFAYFRGGQTAARDRMQPARVHYAARRLIHIRKIFWSFIPSIWFDSTDIKSVFMAPGSITFVSLILIELCEWRNVWSMKLRVQDQAEDQRRPGKRLYVRTVKHVSWIKRMPWTVANGERW